MTERNNYYPESPPVVSNRIDALLGRFALDIALERKSSRSGTDDYTPQPAEIDRLAHQIIDAYDKNGSITISAICRFLELSNGEELDVSISITDNMTEICFIDDGLLED